MTMKNCFKSVFLAVVILLMAVSVSFAANTGKIVGAVIDAETGDPLITANVYLEGTYFGATTDEDGFYMILNVPAGTYNLVVDFMGYAKYTVSAVKVLPDQTTLINAMMQKKEIVGDEITVIAERPLIQKDVTAATQVITEEEISNLSVGSAAGVAQISAGTIQGNNDPERAQRLSIRGGRGGDVAYMVDGFETTNIATGASGANVADNAIAEVIVITGGFNAEYGNAMSGVVNVITKEARENFTGSIAFDTDAIAPDNYGDAKFEASFGGPIIKKQLDFFIAGSFFSTDDHTPSAGWDWNDDHKVPHQALERIRGSFKLKYQPFEAGKFKMGLTYSQFESERFDTRWRYNLDYYYRDIGKDYTAYLKYTHTLSKTTFLDVAVNYFFEEDIMAPDKVLEALGDEFPDPSDSKYYREYDALGNDIGPSEYWNVWEYAKVFTDTTLSHYAQQQGYFDGIDPNDSTVAVGPDGRVDPSFEGGAVGRTFGGLYYVPGSSARAYRWRQTSYMGFQTSVLSQVHKYHELKAGFNFKQYNLKYVEVQDPWTGHPNIPFYDYYWKDPYEPIVMAFYLQDKMEFEGMIVNLGVRFDYFDMATDQFRDPRYVMTSPDGETVYFDDSNGRIYSQYYGDVFESAEAKIQISPRLGISFPVTDDTKFRLNYGYFYQPPELRRVFEGVNNAIQYIWARGNNAIIGDPGLDFYRTIQYEIGLDHRLGETLGASLTLYSKRSINLLNITRVPAPRYTYSLYQNLDYTSVRGLEVAIEKRREGLFSGRFSYTLQRATGTSSYERGNYYDFLTNSTAPRDEFGNIILPKREYPLDSDRTHVFNAVLDMRFAEDEGPEFGGVKPLENFGINTTFRLGSGFPYTPTNIYGTLVPNADGNATADENSSRMPWTFRIDTKISKMFLIAGLNCNVYLNIINLLDAENYASVYSGTGQPDDDGYVALGGGSALSEVNQERYQEAIQRPDFYGTPRRINLGVSVSW